jgi:hypothetical protein
MQFLLAPNGRAQDRKGSARGTRDWIVLNEERRR